MKTRILTRIFSVFFMSTVLSGVALGATTPTYTNYQAPNGLGTDAGEPSIGANWNSGNTMYQAGVQTLRVSFEDSTTPASATWKEVSFLTTSTVTLDPILFTDSRTGRTFVSQLLGACSAAAFTDNDGSSYTPSQGCGAGTLFDHQTVGGGPFAPPLAGVIYPDAVYYCAQDVVSAQCAISYDGGLNFGAGVPVYTAVQCSGLHGHIKVGPEGIAYLPNKNCGSNQQGVAVSTDNNTSWTVRLVPNSKSAQSDPSVGIGSKGTLYFGYQNGSGHPRITVSPDHGKTWVSNTDVGKTFDIKNSVFPAVVAGDDDRAAFAFLGTPTGGDFQAKSFDGIWHLYIATTYDGGQNWTTVDATPDDPVQRGPICLKGTSCSGNDRNLLDFMDATVDRFGRVLVGYADGCIDQCVSGPPNSFSALATIARQSGGTLLYRDPRKGTGSNGTLLP